MDLLKACRLFNVDRVDTLVIDIKIVDAQCHNIMKKTGSIFKALRVAAVVVYRKDLITKKMAFTMPG